MLLSECVKFSENKASVIGQEDFPWIVYECEAFNFAWLFLLHGLAERSKKFQRTATPSQRGPRIISEWSASDIGLISEYLTKVRAKLESLGQPVWSPEMLDPKDDMSVIYFLTDPVTRCGDIASSLACKARECAYTSALPRAKAADYPGELSSKEIRTLLQDELKFQPQVAETILDHAPEVSKRIGLPMNRELFELGAPCIIEAARMDVTPRVYAEKIKQQQSAA